MYRTEYWGKTAVDNDGQFNSVRLWDNHPADISNYVKEYSLIHNEEAEVTNLYCSLVMLTSFLEQKGYNYLIWNGTNTFKPIDFLAPFVHPFWSQLKKNKNVIDFEDFSFCQYNLSKGHVPIDYKLYKEFGHHGEAAHRDFATYLIENYLNEI